MLRCAEYTCSQEVQGCALIHSTGSLSPGLLSFLLSCLALQVPPPDTLIVCEPTNVTELSPGRTSLSEFKAWLQSWVILEKWLTISEPPVSLTGIV